MNRPIRRVDSHNASSHARTSRRCHWSFIAEQRDHDVATVLLRGVRNYVKFRGGRIYRKTNEPNLGPWQLRVIADQEFGLLTPRRPELRTGHRLPTAETGPPIPSS